MKRYSPGPKCSPQCNTTGQPDRGGSVSGAIINNVACNLPSLADFLCAILWLVVVVLHQVMMEAWFLFSAAITDICGFVHFGFRIMHLLSTGVRSLYGGEADEAIRFMECSGSCCDQWIEQIEEEKRLVEALNVVKGKVKFYYGENPNDNKVEASVWCCWDGGNRTFRRVKEQCDKIGTKPTHLEALRALRVKILSEHACVGHVPHPRGDAARDEQ